MTRKDFKTERLDATRARAGELLRQLDERVNSGAGVQQSSPAQVEPRCHCGKPISDLRQWAGKTDCVDCEQAS